MEDAVWGGPGSAALGFGRTPRPVLSPAAGCRQLNKARAGPSRSPC